MGGTQGLEGSPPPSVPRLVCCGQTARGRSGVPGPPTKGTAGLSAGSPPGGGGTVRGFALPSGPDLGAAARCGSQARRGPRRGEAERAGPPQVPESPAGHRAPQAGLLGGACSLWVISRGAPAASLAERSSGNPSLELPRGRAMGTGRWAVLGTLAKVLPASSPTLGPPSFRRPSEVFSASGAPSLGPAGLRASGTPQPAWVSHPEWEV